MNGSRCGYVGLIPYLESNYFMCPFNDSRVIMWAVKKGGQYSSSMFNYTLDLQVHSRVWGNEKEEFKFTKIKYKKKA